MGCVIVLNVFAHWKGLLDVGVAFNDSRNGVQDHRCCSTPPATLR